MNRVRRLGAGLYWVWTGPGRATEQFQVARVRRQLECGCVDVWEVTQRFGLRSQWVADFPTLHEALVSLGVR